MIHRAQARPTVSALWRHCRDLFVTQSAPSTWFDPRPHRRVRRNRRKITACRRLDRYGLCRVEA